MQIFIIKLHFLSVDRRNKHALFFKFRNIISVFHPRSATTNCFSLRFVPFLPITGRTADNTD